MMKRHDMLRRDMLRATLGTFAALLLGGRRAGARAGANTLPVISPKPVYCPVAAYNITTRPLEWDRLPVGIIQATAGHVNDCEFAGHPAGTLLVMGMVSERWFDRDGPPTRMARVHFRRRLVRRWGEYLDEHGTPRTLADGEGRPPYPSADFATILPGGESILDGAEVEPSTVETIAMPGTAYRFA